VKRKSVWIPIDLFERAKTFGREHGLDTGLALLMMVSGAQSNSALTTFGSRLKALEDWREKMTGAPNDSYS
jgi:hypothetical protein